MSRLLVVRILYYCSVNCLTSYLVTYEMFFLLCTAEDPKVSGFLECCVCQDKCIHPVQLPCKHVFCYLCIKGVAARNNKCALCRQQIPAGYMDNPSVIDHGKIESVLKENSHSWFYEAKNGGWWMYEQRTSAEIEKAFNEQKESIRVQISGFFYIIDLDNMVQYREGMSERQRRIRRGHAKTQHVKGVAGISIKTSTDKSNKLTVN